jgi:putative hemolysin
MALAQEAPAIARSTARPGHVVDVLIEERAPRLAGSPLWPIVRPLLYALLDYRKARRMADAIAPLSGKAAIDYCSDLLALKLEAHGLERLPRTGRLILICNHPTGIADGVAVYDAIKTLRPDVMFYANADAHRISPALDQVLIPVEWVDEKRTREKTRLTLTMTRQAMETERALVIFPAGRIARRRPNGTLADPPWAPTALSIARKYDAPIAPVHLSGPWSTLFHFFNNFSGELRDITVFHELLNKRGGQYRMSVGPIIAADAVPHDSAEATPRLKVYIETLLPLDSDLPFP